MGSPPASAGFPQPTANNAPCMIDPTKKTEQFNLLDYEFMPIVASGTTTLIPLAAPTSEAQANAMGDASKYPLPVYYFEKPANAPDGVYDIVMLVGSTPRYLAKLNNGRVVLTTTSTGARVQTRQGQQMQTTVFKVDCMSKITAVQNGQAYYFDKSGRNVQLTAGTAAKGMIAHSLKAGTKAHRKRRSLYNEGLQPRCGKYPEQLTAKARKNAPPATSNGCSGLGYWAPDFTFGSSCNKHDLCYENCESGTWDNCNQDFFDDMINEGCLSKKHWYMWLIWGACNKAAEAYALAAATWPGAKAFVESGAKRCECSCPSPQFICGADGSDKSYCANIFSNEQTNCGACGRTCPEGSKCKGGNCVCPIDQCGKTCLDLRQNPFHCGKCNNACPDDKPYCLKGTCIAAPKECIAGLPNPNFEGDWRKDWQTSVWSDTIFGNTPTTGYNEAYDHPGQYHFYILTPRGGGITTNTFSTTITACPNKRYKLGFGYYKDQGSDTCTIEVLAAGQIVFSSTIGRWDQNPSQQLEMKEAQLGPFMPGGEVVKNGLSLNVPVTWKMVCPGDWQNNDDKSQTRFGRFTLTAL
ncbi:hypothetical protein CB0940_04911 [Cercospora beticola]|uniref:Uncharacterized protein n=1 Tax=Cercospora beticola TaxID=122368 RepID=A0A2G5HJH5_CERBT|nr:hypothetical protein CB0940_04911 [Cercospora beticola]PIA92675.1 hypothetical protein CB0940_04911 [Cercospora beticola]WPB02196.1 hypothetical protein RHO25_006830 [Cercospora beticola]CAK1362944.1 unnamed protein product [Cercospora beticola]